MTLSACARTALWLFCFVVPAHCVWGATAAGTLCSPTPCTGTIDDNGVILIDNTPNPGTSGVVTNMSTVIGGKNFGVEDRFSLDGIQVMQRNIAATPHALVDESGVSNTASTSYGNYGKAGKLTYFANGQHLFDLDRLRNAADWLSSNVSASTGTCSVPASVTSGTPVSTAASVGQCHPAGTYGTISWSQFIDNIKNARTMYGIVRILVPLELNTGTTSVKNALNATVASNTIYGFCSTTTGLCANAPTSSTNIMPGKAVGGKGATAAVVIPTVGATMAGGTGATKSRVIAKDTASGIAGSGQLKVRGSLMFDFVSNVADAVYATAGTPIELAHLPFQPRDIYFKVTVPINVNAGNDKDGNGVLDNIEYISSLSARISCATYPCKTTLTSSVTIDSGQVPQESIEAYNYQFGTNYTGNTDSAFVTAFNAMDKATQYHMLMASGYVQGWYDAFQELGITAALWRARGFTLPTSVGSSITKNDIRSSSFEDLPTYLYTGGLVDMHYLMNISGLMYVPQAAEIEQKSDFTPDLAKMFMMGAVVVRDGFFFEGRPAGITMISSDPQSFNHLKVNAGAITGATLTTALSTLHGDSTGRASPSGVGLAVSGGGSSGVFGGGGGGGGGTSVGRLRWIEVRPTP